MELKAKCFPEECFKIDTGKMMNEPVNINGERIGLISNVVELDGYVEVVINLDKDHEGLAGYVGAILKI